MKRACGVGQEDGFSEVEDCGARADCRSDGISVVELEFRGKNQMDTASLVHCTAYTPPPFLLKAGPKLAGFVSAMEQPTFLPWLAALTSQLGVARVPVNKVEELEIAQPAVVCMVMLLPIWSLTPSTMSISPYVGHAAPEPRSQSAGHVPQPVGMCAMSKMNRPWVQDAVDSTRTDGRPSGAG